MYFQVGHVHLKVENGGCPHLMAQGIKMPLAVPATRGVGSPQNPVSNGKNL